MMKSVMLLGHMIIDTLAQVQQLDPAQGDWYVGPKELDVWVDVSSLAAGVALHADGGITEMHVGCGR